ncbi:MAG: UDP-N-acetylmuramate dehydrogenase [Nitrospirales bacterium]|nr:UDP-N-acetylmuramate dehydrogenase [Nitrospirales bacterium]
MGISAKETTGKDRLLRALQDVEGDIEWGVPLATMTSLQVGGPADVLVAPKDIANVARILLGARTQHVPVVVLGGTNVVVRDKGIRGIVMQLKHLTATRKDAAECLYAEAGVRMPVLMQYAVRHQLSGMEWAAGIPGTVGGGVAMNAGTRLGEMKDALQSVDFVNSRGRRMRIEASALTFSYRKTVLPKGIVVGAWFQLKAAAREQIEQVTKSYLQYRKESQPLTLPNAGSVFKNPTGQSAGKLVESLGLKGLRVGDAEISTKHANFIVNQGHATASDVLALIRKVRGLVAKKLGIHLELELKILGER